MMGIRDGLSVLTQVFSSGRKKEVPVKPDGKPIVVNLPLNVPCGIRNWIQDYWRWKDDQANFPLTKDQICEELFKECKRWHLFRNIEVAAGFILINTSVGVSIVSNSDNRDFPYLNITNGWDEIDGKVEGVEKKKMSNGKVYKYVRA